MSQIEKRVFPKHKHRLCNRLTFSSSLFKHKFEAKQKKVKKKKSISKYKQKILFFKASGI